MRVPDQQNIFSIYQKKHVDKITRIPYIVPMQERVPLKKIEINRLTTSASTRSCRPLAVRGGEVINHIHFNLRAKKAGYVPTVKLRGWIGRVSGEFKRNAGANDAINYLTPSPIILVFPKNGKCSLPLYFPPNPAPAVTHLSAGDLSPKSAKRVAVAVYEVPRAVEIRRGDKKSMSDMGLTSIPLRVLMSAQNKNPPYIAGLHGAAMKLTDLTERGVRRVVKDLTAKGHLIISPRIGGYYIADPKSEEVQIYIRRSRARIYAEMKTLKILDSQAAMAAFEQLQVGLFKKADA